MPGLMPYIKVPPKATVIHADLCKMGAVYRLDPSATHTASRINPKPPTTKFVEVLAIVDRTTRYVALIPLRDTTTTSIIHAFQRHWLNRFGYPRTVTTDNGGAFSGRPWTSFWVAHNVMPISSAKYHPEANGIVEAQFRTVPQLCRLYCEKHGGTWVDAIPHVETVRNCTPSRA
jgi:transposase InsO family protein